MHIRRSCIACLIVLSLSSPFVFGRTIQEPEGPVSAGVTLYRQGKLAEAEAALLSAIKAVPSDAAGYYWLGMVYSAQHRVKDAEAQFKKALRVDSKLSRAYTGLGLVQSQRSNRGIEAQEYFKRAIALDPRDPEPHYQLALLYLRWSQKYLEGPIHTRQARSELARVIELDPHYADACYQLGLSYEETGHDAEAIPYFQQQLQARPDHWDARYHQGLCELRIGRYQNAIQTLLPLNSLDDESRRKVSPRLALAYQRMGEYERALDAYEQYLRLVDPAERALYVDLTPVLSLDEARQYQSLHGADQEEYRRQYWQARDPAPMTPVNERLVEHYRRVFLAREHFSKGKSPWDRRGAIYIRLGDPDDRQRFTAGLGEDVEKEIKPTANLAVEMIRRENRDNRYKLIPQRPEWVESWVYVDQNVELFFIDEWGNGAFDYPPVQDMKYLMYEPRTVAEIALNKAPEVYHHDYGGEPMEFAFDVLRFRGTADSTRIEIIYAVPEVQLGTTADRKGATTSLERSVALFDTVWHSVGRMVSPTSTFLRRSKSPSKDRVLVGRQSGQMIPGTYHAAVQIRDRATSRIGVYKTDVQIEDYRGTDLMISDIELADAIMVSEPTSELVKHGLQVIPNPSKRFPRQRPVALYYEVYNLQPDQNGRTAYQTEMTITAAKKGTVSGVLSGLGRVIGRSQQGNAITMNFESSGTSPTEIVHTALDLRDSPPDSYTLMLRVIDATGHHEATRTVTFRLEDGQAR